MEADPTVQHYAKDLLSVADHLKATLTAPKLRYAFDGLGYTAARLFMDQLVNIDKMSDAGIKKMCRNILCIQQALNCILYERDTELDNARQLYELLYLTPDVRYVPFVLFLQIDNCYSCFCVFYQHVSSCGNVACFFMHFLKIRQL